MHVDSLNERVAFIIDDLDPADELVDEIPQLMKVSAVEDQAECYLAERAIAGDRSSWAMA